MMRSLESAAAFHLVVWLAACSESARNTEVDAGMVSHDTGAEAGGGGGSGGSGGGSGGGGSGGSADAGIDTRPSDAAVPMDHRIPSAGFRMIYDTIIMPKCGSGQGTGCHVTNVEPGRLAMPDAVTAFANLVDVRVNCAGSGSHIDSWNQWIRVVPFKPDASAVMWVNRDGLCGRRHNGFLPSSFGAADLAAFEAWITAGAK